MMASPAGCVPEIARRNRIDDLRSDITRLIALWRASDEAARRAVLIRIRARQDAIGTLRQRNLSLFAGAGALSWIDSWDPDVDGGPAGDARAVAGAADADSGSDDRRSARRAPCFLIAHIRSGLSEPRRCTIRDTSSTGALLELPVSMEAPGAHGVVPVRFRLVTTGRNGPWENDCTVVWTSGRRIGVRYAGEAERWPRDRGA